MPWCLTFPEDSSTFGTELNENTLEEVPMFLFGPVGPTELILIVLIVVIIFGARRLPELGKSLGDGNKNFKKSSTSKEKENESKDESEPPSKEKWDARLKNSHNKQKKNKMLS